MGTYTVILQVTGVFRDSRNAAFEIKRMAMETAEREKMDQDRQAANHHGGAGWYPVVTNPTKIEVT